MASVFSREGNTLPRSVDSGDVDMTPGLTSQFRDTAVLPRYTEHTPEWSSRRKLVFEKRRIMKGNISYEINVLRILVCLNMMLNLG